MNLSTIIAIDLSKRTMQLCVVDGDGTRIEECRVPRDRLLEKVAVYLRGDGGLRRRISRSAKSLPGDGPACSGWSRPSPKTPRSCRQRRAGHLPS